MPDKNTLDDKFIAECPKCHKKFRINKRLRFQCKYCTTLISPDWDWEDSKELKTINIPQPLRGTQEQLVGTTQKMQRQRLLRVFTGSRNALKYISYWYDMFLSQGAFAMFLTLVVLFVVTWVFCICLYLVFGAGAQIGSVLWTTLRQLCDPGSLADANDTNGLIKTVAFLTGMLGVMIFSILIAFLTNVFDQKIQSLKKGYSDVMESGHTLILGWNDKITAIVSELLVACEDKKRTVVILCNQPKEKVEDILHAGIKNFGNLRVIVRYGEISNIHDLEKVAISQVSSIILLNETSKHPTPKEISLADTSIIKAVLSICKNPARRPEPFHIVTELNDPDNISIARSIAEDEVTIFYPNEIIAKILVQTSRQNGLATVYNEILSFSGNELYCVMEPRTYNKTLGNVLYDFPNAIPLGIRPKGQIAKLNPPLTTLIHPGDELILIAPDEDSLQYTPASLPPCPWKLANPGRKRDIKAERQLLLGWNIRIENIIIEYANYLPAGSLIDIAVPKYSKEMQESVAKLQQKLSKIKIRLIQCDYRIRSELQEISPFYYHNIVLLASELGDKTTAEEIDSQTIYVLLLLRDMQNKVTLEHDVKLITELLDPANQELIQIARVNDFIISNQLSSMVLAQVSLQKSLSEVYQDLFNAEGSEIYLKPVSLYVERFPIEISFYDIMALVAQRQEVAFGYRIQRWAARPDLNFGIQLNPNKLSKVWLEAQDQIIVVAEDDL